VESDDLIGKGGFGTVFKATDKNTEKVYAIKKTRLHLPLDPDISQLDLR
jgi:serine/threonine protein kinase